MAYGASRSTSSYFFGTQFIHMVTCLNCPPGKPKSYTGKEPSPNGVGYSASFEIAGKIMKGREGFTKCLSTW